MQDHLQIWMQAASRLIGVRCPACENCQDGTPCMITDNCPMLWCACHHDEDDDGAR